MYKYDSIVDTKTTIQLSRDKNENDYSLVRYELPLEFFNEYKKELSEIQELFKIYDDLSTKVVVDILTSKMYEKDIFQHAMALFYQICKSDGYKYLVNKYYVLTNVDMESLLVDVFSLIYLFKLLYPDKLDYFNNLDKRLTEMQNYLYRTDKIIITDPYINIMLPNAWYITSNGVLYNTMGFEEGHSESNLRYPLDNIRLSLFFGKNVEDKSKQYLEEYNQISEREYITTDQFFEYLNLCGKLSLVDGDRIYNKTLLQLTKGIIMAHVDLYKAFSKFKEIDNKGKNYVKLLKLTNYSLDDIFVRFLGMSKVNVSGTKAICTASRDDGKFSEYLENGHYLDYVNPIEVKDGIIQERDLSDFDVIRRVLKQ